MLTCESVRAALPGLETGESGTGALLDHGELRDHLASCESCRQEAGRLRSELESMRGDLAALAPSPFLADAVVAAARTQEATASPRRTRGVWVGAAVAVAAAALVVGVLLVKRNGANSNTAPTEVAGEGDDAGCGLVAMPDDLRAVNAARALTWERSGGLLKAAEGKRGAGPGQYIHVQVDADEEIIVGYAKQIAPRLFEPRADGVVFRWVFREADVRERDRMYGILLAPHAGVLTLGKGLLARIGGSQGKTEDERAAAGLARLGESLADDDTLLVDVSDPTRGGARARVRVQVNDGYEGHLLLDEHLGRALGLHHFEIPGRATLVGDLSIHARRAYARVRIPEIEFDEQTEVEVLADGVLPTVASGGRGAPGKNRIVFAGARPDSVFVADSIRAVEEEGRAVVSMVKMVEGTFDPRGQKQAAFEVERDRRRHIALGYEGGPHPGCSVLLAPEDESHTISPRSYALERVTLPGPFPAGAQAVIGRVWRGRTAIPTRESVALTVVGTDGSLSFVRSRGEPGPLRIRLFTQEEEVKWYTVDLDEERPEPLDVEVDPGGTVTLNMHTIALLDPDLKASDRGFDPAAMKALVDEFKKASTTAGWDGGISNPSPLEARIRGKGSASWGGVLGTFVAGSQAGVSQYLLALDRRPGRDVPFRLPRDRGLSGPDNGLGPLEEEESPAPGGVRAPRPDRKGHLGIDVRLKRKQGVTRCTIRSRGGEGGLAEIAGSLAENSADLHALGSAVHAYSETRRAKRRLQARIMVWDRDLVDIRYDEVLSLILVLRQAGVDDIFMMSPIPSGGR